jgi:hypothetical protein
MSLRSYAARKAENVADSVQLPIATRRDSHDGALDEAKANAAAQLCRLAGADETLSASRPRRGGTGPRSPAVRPFSGGLRSWFP